MLANLEKLEAQVRAVTTTQEAVKADIAGAVWLEQNVWNLKRDMYVRLLEALGDLFADANYAAYLYRKAERKQEKRQVSSQLDIERAMEVGGKMRDTQRRVAQCVAIAGMVVHYDAIQIVQQGLARWSESDSLTSAAAFEALRGDAERIMVGLQVSGTLDLHKAQ